MKFSHRYLSAFLSVALLSGCGTPGAPQPPSLRLPKPVEYLRAIRKGDKVFLRWQEPTETTDRQGVKGETTMRLCRNYRTQSQGKCNNVVTEIKSIGNVSGKPIEQVDDLATILRTQTSQDYVTYDVETFNDRERAAGPSNAVTIFLAPSLPAPANLFASLPSRKAIVVQWNGAPLPLGFRNLNKKYFYKVMRQIVADKSVAPPKKPPAPTVLAELPAAAGPQSYQDTNFEWENTYVYRIVGVTQVLSQDGKLLSQFDGDDSPTAQILAHDLFAPEPPQGLQAIFTSVGNENYIDLTWSPSDENDLAGYNIYRSEEHQPPVQLNTALLKTPTFRDHSIVAGRTYIYRVTAVDLRNNESQPSQPATEKAPPQ